MEIVMKKTLVVAAILFSIAVPAVAESYVDKADDVHSDTLAIQKDNTALAYDKQNLKHNRAAKAVDKINGDSSQQAIDSAKIGANQTAIEEKKTEKNVDKRVLNHDEQQ